MDFVLPACLHTSCLRPVDSPYARVKMREREALGNGQKGPSLSELDMLIGDVLYFNHRVSEGVRLLMLTTDYGSAPQ